VGFYKTERWILQNREMDFTNEVFWVSFEEKKPAQDFS
jgi:hypothetical protein